VRVPAYLLFVICLAAALLLAGRAQQHDAVHWSYSGSSGPNAWGDLKPEFALCKTGQHQSPINIHHAQKADLKPIQFQYRPSPLRIIDNGHTIMINYAAGSYITIDGKRYELKQFHFHRPSEERIAGTAYDMSAHLVHADEKGNLAVVAVLLKSGHPNALIQELWKRVPKEKEKEVSDNVQIDATALLPQDHGYYTFPGSLTTPPCSENVTWYVLKTPVTVSAAEVEQFERLYHNARPPQPLNGRIVLESR